jgi:hypothetical protein
MKAFLILILLVPVRRANAQDHRLPTDNLYASNDLRECSSEVRHSIKSARKQWGRFEFTCVNGIVQDVFVSTISKISFEPRAFVQENLGLFNLTGEYVSVSTDSVTINQGRDNRLNPSISIERHELGGSSPRKAGVTANDLMLAQGVIMPGEAESHFCIALRFVVTDRRGGFRKLFR